MAKVKVSNSSESSPKLKRPALSIEGREQQMISYAVDLAEQQLLDGTASSQVITHYLKLGSVREQLERERLEEENKLLRAKTKALEDAADLKALVAEGIAAMKSYGGNGDPEEYEY